MLFLVGGGRGEELVKRTVEELKLQSDVCFVGRLAPVDLWTFLSSCDIFVFPTLSEGFPNVLLEAMACSLPIISSDFSGVEDILPSEKNGYLFPKKDHIALAEKIMDMCQNEHRTEIGSFNSDFVGQFNWSDFMDGFERIVESTHDNKYNNKNNNYTTNTS